MLLMLRRLENPIHAKKKKILGANINIFFLRALSGDQKLLLVGLAAVGNDKEIHSRRGGRSGGGPLEHERRAFVEHS